MSKSSIKIICDDQHITRRCREAVKALIDHGISHDDIARLTDTTVVSLISDTGGISTRAQHIALATHFHVSRLWLWTGYGPIFLDPSKLKFRIV